MLPRLTVDVMVGAIITLGGRLRIPGSWKVPLIGGGSGGGGPGGGPGGGGGGPGGGGGGGCGGCGGGGGGA